MYQDIYLRKNGLKEVFRNDLNKGGRSDRKP